MLRVAGTFACAMIVNSTLNSKKTVDCFLAQGKKNFTTCRQYTAQQKWEKLNLSKRTAEVYRIKISEKMKSKIQQGMVVYILKT